LRKLPAIAGGDQLIPSIAFSDKAELSREINGCLGLKAVNNSVVFTVKKNKLDTS
jgi:hypothetical protein